MFLYIFIIWGLYSLPLQAYDVSVTKKYCDEMDSFFDKYNWGKSGCHDYQWEWVRKSINGRPLVWKTYGQYEESKNVTLIMCGVHGDEVTPVKFCFDTLNFQDQKEIKFFNDKFVIVAPLVSPDSFFKARPTRTNATGVDINRNFPTEDWYKNALKLWKNKYSSDKRRYPGAKPNSEQETIFQVNLIKRYKPEKIISVHSPLTLLDYDGPGDNNGLDAKTEHGKNANNLLYTMSESAEKYKVKDYPFFPGSLGNWAGKERGIPVYTIELPSSDERKHKEYWDLFRDAISKALESKILPEKK